MIYFRVELRGVELLLRVLDCAVGTFIAVANCAETVGKGGDMVVMAHPNY